MQLEDSLDVTIDEDDLGDVRTVGDAVDLILASAANVTAHAPLGDRGDDRPPGPPRRRRHRHGGQGPGGLTVDELCVADGGPGVPPGDAVRRLRAVGRLRLRGHGFDPSRTSARRRSAAPTGGPARHRRLIRRPGRGHRGAPLGVEPVRCGVVAGSGIGGIRTLEQQILTYAEKGPARSGRSSCR